jgi:hypothetical protein
MLAVILLVVLVVHAAAKCDNACSGHGRCGQNGVCTCYDNWGLGLGHLSGDCSQRVCPYEFAWVDSPNKQGRFHKYAECSNRGICNRDTGDCECFPGYEGKACARTTCPNDCSGHGQCKDINTLPYTSSGLASTDWRYGYFLPNLNSETAGDAYKQWDSKKTRGCVCDPEYGDVDCSKRMCMYGTDVMDQRQDLKIPGKYQVQHIHLQVENVNGVYDKNNLYKKTFALVFKSKLNETFTTQPIVLDPTAQGLHDFSLDVTKALTSLPNQVIDHVKVQAVINTATSQNAFAFFDKTTGPGVTISCKVTKSTSFTGCLQILYGVKFGTKITGTTSTGTPITFAGASYTTVATLASGVEGTLAASSDFSGTAFLTFSNFQTSTVPMQCNTGVTTCSNVAGNYVGYGAVVKPATGNQVTVNSITSSTAFTITAVIANAVTSALPPMSNLNSLGLGGAVQVGSDLLPSHNYIYMNITFDGNNVQGPQHPIMVKDILCGDGCTPKLTGLNLLARTQNVTEIQKSDFNSYECGRRGKCDYTTGQCTCFSGYTGLSCNVITSLV